MAPPRTCECGTCAKCTRRIYMRRYYVANRDRVCEIARGCRKRHRDTIRVRDRARGYRPGAPEKRAARNAVKAALEAGRLRKRPCEVCGSPRVHAHHDDYSRPLDVRWLCARHHGLVHRAESA